MSSESRGPYCGMSEVSEETANGWQLFQKYLKRQGAFKKRARKLGYENFFHAEVTPAVAAQVLGCTLYQVRKAIAENQLSARRVGKFFLLHGHDLWVYYQCYL